LPYFPFQRLAHLESATVIGDGQFDRRVGLYQTKDDAIGFGMFSDIVQSFLDYPVDRASKRVRLLLFVLSEQKGQAFIICF
jgi:hypothetical protein